MSEFPALVVASSTHMDCAIDEMLAKTAALFSASRIYVMLDEKDGKYLRNTHEWASPSISSTIFSWPLYDYDHDVPSLREMISSRDFFHGNVSSLPSDMARVLAKQGVRTFCVSPIKCNGKRIGLVGMDFCENEYAPPPEAALVFHALAGFVAFALERKHCQAMRVKLASIRDCVSEIEPLLAGFTGEEEAPPSRNSRTTTLIDAERRIIIETLELYNGNKLKTAKHLGLTWPSLDRRCKKLGIEAEKR